MSFSMSPFPLRFGSRQGGGGFTPHFWVDSENGDDGNDGTSAEAAFQTLGAAETAALSRGNGTKIGLVRGSSWEEDLDLSTLTGAQVRAVGEGAMPQLDGSYLFEGTWDDSTDRADANTNVYSTSVSQTEAEGYITVWPSDGYLKWATSLANCQSTAGSMYISGPTAAGGKSATGTQTLYIHPIGSTDANSDGKTYRITDPTRKGCLQLGDNGTVVGLETRRNMQADGSLKMGTSALAIGCFFHEGVKHEALLESGAYRYCVGKHLGIDSRTTNIIMEFFASDGSGLSCEYSNCLVEGPGLLDVGQSVAGFSGHNSGPGTRYDSISFTDCAGFNIQTVCGGETESAQITRVRGHNSGSISVVSSAAPVSIIDPWAHILATNANSARLITSSPSIVDGLRLYVADGADCGGISFGQSIMLTQSVVKISGTTLGVSLIDDQSAGIDVTFQGVIIDVGTATAGTNVAFNQAAGGADISLSDFENNIYYIANPASARLRFILDGTTYFNPTTYLAASTSFETGSIAVDPELSDPANGDFSHGSNVTNGAGLARPDVTYWDNPADPRAWIAANAPI